ncbi:MAG: Rho termination factor, partial [Planctomycetaceae bacterium]
IMSRTRRNEPASSSSAPRRAKAASDRVVKRPAVSPPLDDWSKEDLYEEAKRRRIAGRSLMTREELVAALQTSR